MRRRVERAKQQLDVIIIEFVDIVVKGEVVVDGFRPRGRRIYRRDGAELVNRQMKRLLKMSVGDGNVPIRSEDNVTNLIL
jgi:hypothetical protein